MTTVLIADDQPLQRLGFRMLLQGTPGLTPVGEAAHGAEAVRLHRASYAPTSSSWTSACPAWTAWRRPAGSSPPAGRTRVLIVTTFDLDEYAYDGLRAGASGFLLKDARPEELVAGIHAVATGTPSSPPA